MKLISDYGKTIEVLEKTIAYYESSYQNQWDQFPEEYKAGMAKGIVAFEMTITDLQAKKKLSQNRSASEKQRIIETLADSQDTNEKLIADYMQGIPHE